jgi:pantoate--beta-alanine ligase
MTGVEVVRTIPELRRKVGQFRMTGLKVGLVPTMGYLHDGHAELIRRARQECGLVVVSVFVNPTQFGPQEDLEAYPRDLPRDLTVAEAAGAGLVFVPEVAEIYPEGFQSYVEVLGLSGVMCGASRPGHFRGVTTVVAKLLNIVGPDRAYFGQKDYQQTVVIRRMVQDLNLPVEIVVVPTVREADGLAMSSRNAYLDPLQRQAAVVLHRALELAEAEIHGGERDAKRLAQTLIARVEQEPLARLDYLTVASPETLMPLDALCGRCLVALAVTIGRTRLIDNAEFDVPQ